MQPWMTMMDTRTLLATMAAADLLIVLGLGWLLRRIRHERETALAGQRTTLLQLRTELGELVSDAEARTQALENQMSAREASLRALLHEIGRAQTARREIYARPDSPAASQTRSAPRRRQPDPAEERLRRDLEAAFAEGVG